MTVLAVVAAALAVWVLVRPGDAGLARCEVEPPGPRRGARVSVRALGVLVSVGIVTASGAIAGVRAAVLACVTVLVVGTAALLGLRYRARRYRAQQRTEVAWAGEVLAGLLRAGHVPATALEAAASETIVLRSAADAQAVGGDVADALRRASVAPGREGLLDLSDAWAVASRTGASLCAAVEATAEQLAGRQEVARTVAAELSAPRATGLVLAALPAAGLLLGFGFGGNPIAFLLESPGGWACLVSGVALVCAGVLWTEALADKAAGD